MSVCGLLIIHYCYTFYSIWPLDCISIFTDVFLRKFYQNIAVGFWTTPFFQKTWKRLGFIYHRRITKISVKTESVGLEVLECSLDISVVEFEFTYGPGRWTNTILPAKISGEHSKLIKPSSTRMAMAERQWLQGIYYLIPSPTLTNCTLEKRHNKFFIRTTTYLNFI